MAYRKKARKRRQVGAQGKRLQKLKSRKRKHSRSHSKSRELQFLPSAETSDPFLIRFLELNSRITSVRAVHINVQALLKNIRDMVNEYFGSNRPEYVAKGINTQILDSQMQTLLSMTHSRTATSAFKAHFATTKKELVRIDGESRIVGSDHLAKSMLTGPNSISKKESAILDTLDKLVPASSKSYQQVLADLGTKRISYRGSAGELREILREVLDSLAADKDVMSAPGFKLEPNCKRPTMKQKVVYILKKRELSRSAMEPPLEATSIVEESIGRFARAIYTRGSLSAHTDTAGRGEIIMLKQYLDCVLCELLEIGL